MARKTEAVALVEKQLRRQRHFTLPEAAAVTGLAIDEAREALEAMLDKYVCRLQVSDNGDLIYNFGDTLRRRGSKTFAERLREVGAWLWTLFTVVYKAWIALTLVVYFVIFLVLLILLIIAASARQSSDRRRSSPINLGSLAYIFADIFRWRTITGATTYHRDRYGYRSRQYQPRTSVLNSSKKSFIAAVYDFAFGPPRPAIDALQNEKEVAAYLRQNKGIIVASELSALAGWTFPQAETFLTDCIIRYHGDTKISDNAVLYGQFDTITRTVGEAEAGEIEYYWDEYEPEYQLTGNSAGRNLLLICMNGFNLIFALVVLNGGLASLITPQADATLGAAASTLLANDQFVRVFLGWMPLIFSLLFFLIPLLRLMRVRMLQHRRHLQNIRKRLFKAIFARNGQPQTLTEVLSIVNDNNAEERLSRQVVEERFKELVLDMDGDMTVSDAAEIRFAFPRITRELQDAEQIRRHRRVHETLGDIIIESDN